MINLSFSTGYVPSRLKLAKVTPIFKKNDRREINNFRPVSIVPSFSKIFEKMFLLNLSNFIEKHKLLALEQFGFREGRSTIDAVVSLATEVVESLERRESTLSVFIDLSKAFDFVDHSILLHKLQHCGIRGVPLSWIESYLSCRTQRVQISNQLSKPNKINFGVPQGSILSPLLFLVYINDLSSALHHGKLVQYADDTNLCFSDKSITELEIQTLMDLNNIYQHFNSINLNINLSKTTYINFNLRQNLSYDSPTVMLGDSELEEVRSTKFLGIYMDENMTWNDHIDSVCSKLASAIYCLRSLSKYCPIEILLTAYYGMVYPHLTYGVILWGGCSNREFMRIFRLQKKAVRIISKLKSRDSCRFAFQNLQLLTLPCIYILETITYCMSKTTLTRGTDIHAHNTRGRENYRNGQHRTVVFERLPSQAGVRLINSLPNELRGAQVPKALRPRLKKALISNAFYSVDEFLAHNWETY